MLISFAIFEPLALESHTSFDLRRANTLGLPSIARQMLVYRHRSELPELQNRVEQASSVFVLGGGSNVVLGDDIRALMVQVASKGIRLLATEPDAFIVEAEAGEVWHEFVQYCLNQGWPGLENLALIPGTVGAAPVQNIGAYGVELDQRLHSVLAWHFPSASLQEIPASQCQFAYRESRFKREAPGTYLIVAVRFRLPRPWQAVLNYADLRQRVPEPAPQAVFDAICDIRRSKLPDPAVLGNAGSFFKNPVVSAAQWQDLVQHWPDLVSYDMGNGERKLAAAWLIDQCGWKGRNLGPVGVHQRQALVLVNHGGARAQDIRALAQAIQADVRRVYGVMLEQEPINVE